MRPQVGQLIHNKYRLVRVIGDGGMGSVYEARHEGLGTTVALKFLHPELSRRPQLVERFTREAYVSAKIESPHVVRVLDVDRNEAGQAFIVMEYLEGKTLQTLYEELYHARQRLSYADALEYAMQMLEGVEAAHNKDIIHRDLKPDNVIIMRGKKGDVLKLLDFGIAKLKVTGQLDRGLTRPGIIMGTPEYMAPEQAYSADAVDARADIFSLGVMIFEMLAGRRPVGGDEPHQIATAYLTRNIAKLLDLAPHVPAELAAAVHRAMGPKPEDRWSSVAELRAAIEPFWLATRPAATPAPPGVSMLTPAPAQASPVAMASPAEGQRRVPKTLPPEDEPPAAPAIAQAALAPSGGMSVEVLFSDPSLPAPSLGAHAGSAPATTPVSKTPEHDRSGPTPQPAGSSIVVSARGDAPVNAKAAFAATDATVESPPLGTRPGSGTAAMPMVPANGHASTVEAPPLAMGGANGVATASMPPLERAGGTAIGGSPMFGASPGVGAMPAYVTPMAGLPATASMEPTPYGAPQPARRAARRNTGTSLVLILLAAAAVASAVVGGVYLAQQRAKEQDRNDDPVTTATPPSATVAAEPPSATSSVKAPPQQPLPPRPVPKPSVTATGPGPTTQPTTQPTTSPTTFPTGLPTTMPTIPTSLIPIPLPSLLPFPFPGQQQPSPQPTSDPKPQPTTTGTTTKKPQIIIKFPKNQD